MTIWLALAILGGLIGFGALAFAIVDRSMAEAIGRDFDW